MASDPQKSQYTVKFLFADATFLEESFAADVTVQDAKQKLITIWPAGEKRYMTDTQLYFIIRLLPSFKSL